MQLLKVVLDFRIQKSSKQNAKSTWCIPSFVSSNRFLETCQFFFADFAWQRLFLIFSSSQKLLCPSSRKRLQLVCTLFKSDISLITSLRPLQYTNRGTHLYNTQISLLYVWNICTSVMNTTVSRLGTAYETFLMYTFVTVQTWSPAAFLVVEVVVGFFLFVSFGKH